MKTELQEIEAYNLSQNKLRKKKIIYIDPYPPPEANPYRIQPPEMRAIWFPKLSLPILAGLTPDDWESEIIDESKTVVTPEIIDQQIQAYGVSNLLVGISTQMTCYALRAYEISREYRARGVTVILGGTHATYQTEEALHHADSIVRFEADHTWPKVVRDFEKGTLKRVYEMDCGYPDMQQVPDARTDLLPENTYMTRNCLQTTRGCHFECEFCSVSPFNGKSSRRRPVEEVVAEIARIQTANQARSDTRLKTGPYWQRISEKVSVLTGMNDRKIFAFVDDLHNSNREYCKKLWTALKPLNIKWGAQCTLFLGDEPDMMKLAAESGCVAMFVGMESIMEGSIAEMNKPFNRIKQYEKQIKCFHDHGIMVNPGMIFGSDHEDESVFQRTVEFLIKNKMELAYFNILTPLPGTVLFEKMKTADRIFDWNWSHYDGKYVVYHPKRMTPEVLQQGFFWANQQFFSWKSIFTRLIATKQRLIPRLIMNSRFRRLIYRTTPKGHITPIGKCIAELATEKGELIWKNLKHTRAQMEERLQKQLTNINIEISLLQAEGERVPKFFAKLRGLVRDGNVIDTELAKVKNALTKQMNQHRIPAIISYAELNFKEKKMYMQNFVEKLKRSKKVKVEYTENPDEIYLRPCA